MFYLGLGRDDSSIYLGNTTNNYLCYQNPQPLALPIHFSPEDLFGEINELHKAPGRVFIEESYDPITRIRRGRTYLREEGGTQPKQCFISTPSSPDFQTQLPLFTYQRESLHPLKHHRGCSLPKVIIGGRDFASLWKIVSIEQDINNTFILVLKSYRSLGELPELKEEEIPEEVHERLIERLEHVENSANRETPHNVVDRCCNALVLIFGHLTGQSTMDLADLISLLEKHPKWGCKALIRHASQTTRLLHTRGKPNAEVKYNTPPLCEEDGQLSIRCLGLVLRELGWAE